MQHLIGDEVFISDLLLENNDIKKIVNNRIIFWKKQVDIAIGGFDNITTEGDKKVKINIREYIYLASSNLIVYLPKLPDEQKLIKIIEELETSDNKKNQQIYKKLSELVIEIHSTLGLRQKILFLFLAYAYSSSTLQKKTE